MICKVFFYFSQGDGRYLFSGWGRGAHLTFTGVVHDRETYGTPKSSFLTGLRPPIFTLWPFHR